MNSAGILPDLSTVLPKSALFTVQEQKYSSDRPVDESGEGESKEGHDGRLRIAPCSNRSTGKGKKRVKTQ
ncbi:hypothetical protein GUJ93_ZPchr0132g18696 [Zizania palustris]|uniref:Uncharacterized protein n=1 Tax=Zizania palustris TaxID=103762 RepID=A0A8J5RF71_ZIZPA|nr:hypothetical protein GUJ93_ZPchr0132g18696 [Zizania palustris]